MGSSQSSYATNNNDNLSSINKKSWSSKSRSVRGRKSINTTTTNNNNNNNNTKNNTNLGSAPHGLRASIVSLPSEQLDHILDITSAESVHSDDVVDNIHERQMDSHNIKNLVVVYSDELSESSDDEDDIWDNEVRLCILEDMRQLKCMATYFCHPEYPIKSSGTETARCYFDRYSITFDDVAPNERAMILADAAFLKQSAGHFLHPEASVANSDPCACGRNYFTRFSSPDQDIDESERNSVLADAVALKQTAVHYLHPEIPMTTSVASTRNYFTRPSALEYEYDATERNEILQDVAELRKSAMNYLHPEIPLVTTDTTCYGRNYFMRHSAPNQESLDEVAEHNEIVRDMKLLQQVAEHYLHPEAAVNVSDPTVFGRNYFTRPSAPTQESFDDFKIAQQILEDTNAFHQLAVEYLHPELPLVIYATATGRNFFTRGSGPEYESLQDIQSRSQVMEDLKAFKSLACDFLHPELPVVVYGTSTGRNYFTRPDAESYESLEEIEERERILSDAKAMKQSAVHFLHPEISMVATEGTVLGRNYFTRFSATEYETQTERDIRDSVLADMQGLRQAAFDYLHPEIPMNKSIACARNYYSRASANEYEDLECVKERDQCLAEACALKKLAVDYMHPELPTVTTDGAAFGRSYFTRLSAMELNDAVEDEGRLQILVDTAALKKLAVDYLHPELPVESNVTCTRNYFDRASTNLHDHMIHSFPAHDDDDNSDHHSNEHIDHFGLMDEEMELYHDLRAELEAFPMMDNSINNRSAAGKYGTTINKADSEVGSNLSRSPSSVFLFGLDEATYE